MPVLTVQLCGMRRLFLILAVLGMAVVALLAGIWVWWNHYLDQAGPLQASVVVEVGMGSGPATIARKLHDADVIGNPKLMVVAVRMMGVRSSLKAGEYVFEPHISLRKVIGKLAQGDVLNKSVTIPEGWTVREVIDRLGKTEGLEGNPSRPAEGMLFPDTYTFHPGTDRAKLMGIMQRKMQQILDEAWQGRDPTLPLNTPDDLLTLASIVQKEAANDAEMPRIAGVFVNRLRKGMRLQSDPTVIYGTEQFDGDIRRKDLKDENPFNTYIYAGLPPTPIANPGRAALMAASRPVTEGEELFFVADPSRTGHIFSRTYEEHQKHVRNYWKQNQSDK